MSNEKPEYTLVPQDGELQPVGKIPTVTAEQVNVLAVIQSVSKVEVLANVEETAAGIIKMKTSYLPIVEKAKVEIANTEIPLIRNDVKTESAIIELINDDAGVAEDVAKIIGQSVANDFELIEVSSEVNEDDCVAIPVKHLKSLIRLANYAISHCEPGNANVFGNNDLSAIAFAKSLI